MKNDIVGKFQAVALSALLMLTACVSKETPRKLSHILASDDKKERSFCDVVDNAGLKLIQDTLDTYSRQANIRFELLKYSNGSYVPSLEFSRNSTITLDSINEENSKIDKNVIEDLQALGCEMKETSAAYNAFDLGVTILRSATRRQVEVKFFPEKTGLVSVFFEGPFDLDVSDYETCAISAKKSKCNRTEKPLELPEIVIRPGDNDDLWQEEEYPAEQPSQTIPKASKNSINIPDFQI